MMVGTQVNSNRVGPLGQVGRCRTAVPAIGGMVANGGDGQMDVIGVYQRAGGDRVVAELQRAQRIYNVVDGQFGTPDQVEDVLPVGGGAGQFLQGS